MLGVSVVLLALASLLLIKYILQFVRNYVSASRSGLPYLVIPIDQNNVFWMVSSQLFRPLLKKYLSEESYARWNVTITGWEPYEKLRPFHIAASRATTRNADKENTIVLSTCGRYELWTGDPKLSQQILLRPQDFQQLDLVRLFMSQIGPNVLTEDGDVWSRHRKIVASAVTERISPIAWAESLKQMSGLLTEVCNEPDGKSGETKRFYEMLKTVTIHVLSRAGLGVEAEWTSHNKSQSAPNTDRKPNDEQDVTYMEAVKLTTNYLTGPMLIPTKILSNWPFFLPGSKELRRLGTAKALFPLRTSEMLTEEKERLANTTGKTNEASSNFLSMIVSASQNAANGALNDKTSSSQKTMALTDEEMVGNLYVFTAAGYDTTASTLAYAFTLLMRYPKWQDWLFDEIRTLLDDRQDSDINTILSDYPAIFPKCTRILALMYETLRLFPAVNHTVKMTRSTQTLQTVTGKDIIIPANSTVCVNICSLHLDRMQWRNLNLPPSSSNDPDTDSSWQDDIPGRFAATRTDFALGSANGKRLGDEWRFRPTRWLKPPSTSTLTDPKTESLYQPPRGTFLPWSMGPRVCPGQKMAQVEFTAILVRLLAEYRIEAVPLPNESQTELNTRLDWTMQNSTAKLAMEMDVYNVTEDNDEKGDGETRGIRVRLVKRE